MSPVHSPAFAQQHQSVGPTGALSWSPALRQMLQVCEVARHRRVDQECRALKRGRTERVLLTARSSTLKRSGPYAGMCWWLLILSLAVSPKSASVSPMSVWWGGEGEVSEFKPENCVCWPNVRLRGLPHYGAESIGG
jgi:hypothetical protein